MPQHDWNAVVLYTLDDDTARALCEGPEGPPVPYVGTPPIDPTRATLTIEMIDQERSMVGCMTCELIWHQCHEHPCPGQPIGNLPDGEPVYHHPDATGPVSYESWLKLYSPLP